MSIKLNAQSGGSVALDAPTQTTNSANNVYKLPVADGSAGQVLQTDGSGNLSWVTLPAAGIKMVDQWRRTANVGLNNGSNYLTSDWERVDSGGQGTFTGTYGMTESGGIFTFPDEGIYKVEWQCYFEDTGSAGACAADIYITTNNSSYSQRATSLTSVPDISSYSYAMAHCQTLVDVTDKTQVKVKFRVYSNGSVTVDASSSENRNCATFIRIGDT